MQPTCLTPAPDQNLAPFVEPVGALQNGTQLQNPILFDYYCPPGAAASVMAQLKQAALLQGLTLQVAIVSGTKNGDYSAFTAATDGSDITEIKGTVGDGTNVALVQIVVGERLAGYVNPDMPNKTNYGDHNLVRRSPVVNGQWDNAHQETFQVLGYGVFVSGTTGFPLVAGQVIAGDYVNLLWYPIPPVPVAAAA